MKSKKEIIDIIHSRKVYFDGGLGSLLQERGLPVGTPPEIWNLENPKAVFDIHKEYVLAGCDFITSNTFGVNPLKYDNYRELISSALSTVRKSVEGTDSMIALDIGPLGKLLSPLGDLDFNDAVRFFSNTIEFGNSLGIADAVIIETMNDSLETKAAVLAAKESCDLPIFVTNAYDATGKLMTGASPSAMIAMLEGLGADAIGINCSLGPDLMIPIIEEYVKNSSTPVIVSPNAGLPAYINGKTVYELDSDSFADRMKQISELGVSILGGCCGTTPEYIRKMISNTKNVPFSEPKEKDTTVISSYTHAVFVGGKPVVIGERINPTGKPKLKDALRNMEYSVLAREAVRQADAGADVLDVNTGLPEIDEKASMLRAIKEIQTVTDLPLQIDSSDPTVLEAALRIYNGKALVNSVNGKKEVMDAVFPIVKKYGGTLIALTLDENGIPESSEKRVAIAERITKEAQQYGIKKKDIIIDPLALTVSSDTKSPGVTLKTVKILHQKGYHTSLGISNVSFGLPRRDIVNSSFFLAALESGLSMAILNPFDLRMIEALFSFRLLHGLDKACADFIAFASDHSSETPKKENTVEISLRSAVLSGFKKEAVDAASAEKYKKEPLSAINSEIIPALNEIGSKFESGTAFLPQLLMSAEAAQEAISVLKGYFNSEQSAQRGEMILATVKGDIHDIGKNIVKVLLESYGFRVYDLGKDVDPESVLRCVQETGCRLVGLSALMTTTVPAMEETIALLRSFDQSVRVCVGGAVLTKEYADSIGADKYCPDAMDTVKYAEEFYKI